MSATLCQDDVVGQRVAMLRIQACFRCTTYSSRRIGRSFAEILTVLLRLFMDEAQIWGAYLKSKALQACEKATPRAASSALFCPG